MNAHGNQPVVRLVVIRIGTSIVDRDLVSALSLVERSNTYFLPRLIIFVLAFSIVDTSRSLNTDVVHCLPVLETVHACLALVVGDHHTVGSIPL